MRHTYKKATLETNSFKLLRKMKVSYIEQSFTNIDHEQEISQSLKSIASKYHKNYNIPIFTHLHFFMTETSL
jgi:hypothetical protein